MKERLEKTLNNWHEIPHDFFLLIFFVSLLHDFLEERPYDLEILGDDEARANLLHAEHEHREESVLDFRVI